ncbi:hypothetical protein RHMOL_Rhmol09G0118700 [Rhododendron molle]|uniref:Uncharacterized protein n=1 Tax=Rhododendron molle TaxID=49168 RepID=A0ACC0MDG0_RHOML|nr:hypothetical protein RHMOL_Rhmol09G0118700 [Rhododendron molle]
MCRVTVSLRKIRPYRPRGGDGEAFAGGEGFDFGGEGEGEEVGEGEEAREGVFVEKEGDGAGGGAAGEGGIGGGEDGGGAAPGGDVGEEGSATEKPWKPREERMGANLAKREVG